MKACSMAGYNVIEEFVGEKELSKIEGAFLSGTSIKVLPIASIEGMAYSPDVPAVNAIRKEYDRLVKKYIEKNVNIW
jgi:branched-chain amino acid aminotransferase